MQQQPNFQQPVMVQQQSGRSCSKPLFACLLGPLLLLGCLLGSACACVFVVAQGNPDPLFEDYEPNPALAANYENSVSEAVNSALQNPTGELSIEFQDTEFSSWLNIQSDELFDDIDIGNDNFNSRARPSEYQVRFDNQEVQLYLLFDTRVFDLVALITGQVSAPTSLTSDSLIEIEVTGFKLGSIDILSAVDGNFETNLGDLFVDQLLDEIEERTGTRNITVTSVNVDEGIMQITGVLGR
jgi:hypothetical protein